MELVVQLIIGLVPSLLIFGTSWIILRGFLSRETDAVRGLLAQENSRQQAKLKEKSKSITLPIRLQAYERMTLFCARLDIAQIVRRLVQSKMTAKQLKISVIAVIDEEFKHNITQQMYMSDELWQLVLLAKQEGAQLIRNAAVLLENEETATAQELIEALRQVLEKTPQVGYLQAQAGIKKEVQLLF